MKHSRFTLFLIYVTTNIVVFTGCRSFEPIAVKPAKNITLAGIFSDNMVLQRNMKVPVWGTAEPGKRITVKFGNDIIHTVSDSFGKWQVKLAALKANNTPSELSIIGAETMTLKNILVGDVWLGSGQSNMWWPVSKCDNAEQEIANSGNPSMRLFTYNRKASEQPVSDRRGQWEICGPKTIPGFSGTLYFFGKKIQQSNGVPVGLINSSIGGSSIEPWISRQGFESEKAYKKLLQAYDLLDRDPAAAHKEYQDQMRTWLKDNIGEYGSKGGIQKGWTHSEFNDASWKAIQLPNALEKYDIWLDGSVWFRKKITIPAEWVGKELILSLGRIDDYDTTFCNGEQIGFTDVNTIEPWKVVRNYTIPARLVKTQNLLIAVQVFDIHGLGGFVAQEKDFYLALNEKTKIPLKGTWRYTVESTHNIDSCTAVPEPPSKSLSLYYNGMIHPIAPFPLSGIIWYQGESNTSNPVAYRRLLKTLIRDWRRAWGKDIPFLIAQLANFQNHQPRNPLPKPTTMPDPGPDKWAMLREAQMMALSEAKTGLAVSIDIGDRSDVHPTNKAELGRRLALIAEQMVYGKDLVYSGPLYESMKIENNKIVLSFRHIGGGLVAKDGPLKWFAIAGKSRKLVWADAKIVGNTVELSSKQIKKPVAARYAWARNPEGCNLYNKAGLPAAPFRTDSWEK